MKRERLMELIAEHFQRELGLAPPKVADYEQVFKDAGLDKGHCFYCNRTNYDIHHLLDRSESPEFEVERENMVPLCVHIHDLITRRSPKLTAAENAEYDRLVKQWKSERKRSLFDAFFQKLHESYP